MWLLRTLWRALGPQIHFTAVVEKWNRLPRAQLEFPSQREKEEGFSFSSDSDNSGSILPEGRWVNLLAFEILARNESKHTYP